MRLSRRVIRCCLLALATVLVAGCSGINTSHSVSPATFLVPGLMQTTPPQTTPPTEAESLPLLAAHSR